jgi:hypothetical protein
MSTFSHHLWFVRSRMGAWDVPPRAAKTFISAHALSNKDCDPMFLPPHLGWWGVFDWDGVQPERTFPDTIDYLCCKCIGANCGLSLLVGFTPESYAKSANTQRLGSLIKQYEELRLSNTVSEAAKSRLAVRDDEFSMETAADGTAQFRPMKYASHKIDGLAPEGATWSAHNGFGRQALKVRIEALASVASYDDPEATIIEDFKDAAQFSERASQDGVTAKLESENGQGQLTATSSHPDPENAWTMMGRRFTPPLNVAGRGLGVWIEGDGKGEVLNFQLKTSEYLGGGIQDRYVNVDFTGRRYFELVEPESDRLAQYGWSYASRKADWESKGVSVGKVFRSFVIWADAGHMETLSIGCVNLPTGKTVDCRIGPVKSLPIKKVKVDNPSIKAGDTTLTFPVTLESGDYLEFRSVEDCKVYNATGDLVKEVVPQGVTPILEPGDNELHFTANAEQDGPRSRLRVTVITAGEPFAANGQ